MAEAVVSLVVENIGKLLIGEAAFLVGVRDQIDEMGRELTRMQCFLKDADTKGMSDERIRNWVREVRSVAYDAEDVLDTFVLKVGNSSTRGFVGCVNRCPFIFNKLIALHKIGKEIGIIKKKLSEISASRSTYGIENLGRGREGPSSLVIENLQLWRRASALTEERDVVGFDEDIKALVARLTEGEDRRCVISIVGTGGLGKTTLALKVFNNYDIKKHFNLCAWVVVSQESRVRKVLQDAVEKIMRVGSGELEKMNTEALAEKLSQYLSDKRYFVVMDDIWQRGVWENVKTAFPDAMNGSRMLFTSRKREVALSADPLSPPHELQFLDEKKSWELFSKKVFQSTHCPLPLEDLGKQIAAKASGLPLAILALAGLLLKKDRNPVVWMEVLRSVNWELTEGQEQISNILALSYLDLPYYLKPCFFYFSVFPKDYGRPEADFEISAESLIQLWVAEGFIHEQNREKSMEDVAEDYLEELADRNLVQIVKRSPIGKVEKCRMHDLLRDLATLEAKNNDFSYILVNEASEAPDVRRLAIKDDAVSYSALHHSNPRIRALLWISPNSSAHLSLVQTKSICRSFKLLRVIFIYGPNISTLPNEIGELIHLSYLEWWADFPMEGIPSSIGNLKKLQTICLSSSRPFYLPSAVFSLPQLRFLWLGSESTGIIKGRTTQVTCRNLQTLSMVQVGPWLEDCLGQFTNLRRLRMHGDFRRFGNVVSEFIVNLKRLRILKFYAGSEGLGTLVQLSQHLFLHLMVLSGPLERIPEAHEFPPNLTELSLVGSRLERDPLPTLEKLPSLISLELIENSYVGDKITCSASRFPQLQELTLAGLSELRKWKVEEGAMHNLKRLVINGCDRLEEVPEGLQHIITLRELELIDMPLEFRNRVFEKKDGEDWYKIRHIPFVVIR